MHIMRYLETPFQFHFSSQAVGIYHQPQPCLQVWWNHRQPLLRKVLNVRHVLLKHGSTRQSIGSA